MPGGVDGLIHISRLAWQRVKHPSEVLAVGQEVEVEVLKVDRESKRIGLSLKRRQPDPWQRVAERFQAGQVVEGTLTRLAPFGAFVDLGEGVEGLLPTNQVSGQAGIAEGATVRVKILNVEPERQRIGLALQAVTGPNPAEASGAAAESNAEPATPEPPADGNEEDDYDASAPQGTPASNGEGEA